MGMLQYINERKSWLLFFLFTLGLANFIILLDEGIQVEYAAVIYMDILLMLSLAAFLIWRYRVEMAYIKALSIFTDEQTLTVQESLPRPTFAHEAIVDEVMKNTIRHYEQEVTEIKNQNIIESEYTAAWVHEVKAPLTAMKLMIDEHRNDPSMRRIEAEWLRIHLLIDQQLSIARLSSLETDYILDKTFIQRLIAMEVKELASWCLEKRIAVDFEGDDLEVVTDGKWCRFIFRQILTNAVKYSPIGGSITITFQYNETGNPQILVADEGPGIVRHDLPRIFDKGFTGGTGRLHNAATGLGLYLAQTVAEKMGSKLAAQSEIGKGTVISLTFPTENEFDQVVR